MKLIDWYLKDGIANSLLSRKSDSLTESKWFAYESIEFTSLRIISSVIFRYDDNLVTRNDYTSSHFHRRSWATLRVIVNVSYCQYLSLQSWIYSILVSPRQLQTSTVFYLVYVQKFVGTDWTRKCAQVTFCATAIYNAIYSQWFIVSKSGVKQKSVEFAYFDTYTVLARTRTRDLSKHCTYVSVRVRWSQRCVRPIEFLLGFGLTKHDSTFTQLITIEWETHDK